MTKEEADNLAWNGKTPEEKGVLLDFAIANRNEKKDFDGFMYLASTCYAIGNTIEAKGVLGDPEMNAWNELLERVKKYSYETLTMAEGMDTGNWGSSGFEIVGGLYMQAGNFDKAQELFRTGLIKAVDAGDKPSELLLRGKIVHVWVEAKNPELVRVERANLLDSMRGVSLQKKEAARIERVLFTASAFLALDAAEEVGADQVLKVRAAILRMA